MLYNKEAHDKKLQYQIVGLKHKLLNREATQLMASAIRKISVLPANKLTTAAVQHSLSILGKVLCVHSRKTVFVLQ